ncbi:MAG: hypothetical protein MR000_13280 [Cloacibacillus porcorum]|nr:hypothetical protein [Cloacibacillus porcorum]
MSSQRRLGGGIFRFHMAVIGRSEHLQKGNRVIFLNISKVIYGERCESAKNDDAQPLLADLLVLLLY